MQSRLCLCVCVRCILCVMSALCLHVYVLLCGFCVLLVYCMILYVVCVACGSKWCVCMTDITYEFVYLCMVYDVCAGSMCVCKTAMHICGASCLCV